MMEGKKRRRKKTKDALAIRENVVDRRERFAMVAAAESEDM